MHCAPTEVQCYCTGCRIWKEQVYGVFGMQMHTPRVTAHSCGRLHLVHTPTTTTTTTTTTNTPHTRAEDRDRVDATFASYSGSPRSKWATWWRGWLRQVRFPMQSLAFFIDLILPAALWP
jgi:hypothetical protein